MITNLTKKREAVQAYIEDLRKKRGIFWHYEFLDKEYGIDDGGGMSLATNRDHFPFFKSQ